MKGYQLNHLEWWKLEHKMNGQSYGQGNEFGTRRKATDLTGRLRTLAPRSFRKQGRHYMDEISPEDIASEIMGISRAAYREADVALALWKKEVAKVEAAQEALDAWNKKASCERNRNKPEVPEMPTRPSDSIKILDRVKSFMQL
jgi:hypothetical protein